MVRVRDRNRVTKRDLFRSEAIHEGGSVEVGDDESYSRLYAACSRHHTIPIAYRSCAVRLHVEIFGKLVPLREPQLCLVISAVVAEQEHPARPKSSRELFNRSAHFLRRNGREAVLGRWVGQQVGECEVGLISRLKSQAPTAHDQQPLPDPASPAAAQYQDPLPGTQLAAHGLSNRIPPPHTYRFRSCVKMEF